MVRRTYDGWGYTPLEQVTPNNVARLQPVWVFATGQTNGHEAAPIVNNGVMFVATPGNQVIALDARTGAILWRYRRQLIDDRIVLHPTSRGVAPMRTRFFLPPVKQFSLRLTQRPERKSGPLRLKTIKRAITCRWRHSSPTAR